MSSSWGCPHEVDGVCQRIRGAHCDPGMRGCVIEGRVERIGEPNVPRRPQRAPSPQAPAPSRRNPR
jgi:hypothetical protein